MFFEVDIKIVHPNIVLQDLYNTYGETTIHFEVVERGEEQTHSEKLKEIQEELKAKTLALYGLQQNIFTLNIE